MLLRNTIIKFISQVRDRSGNSSIKFQNNDTNTVSVRSNCRACSVGIASSPTTYFLECRTRRVAESHLAVEFRDNNTDYVTLGS